MQPANLTQTLQALYRQSKPLILAEKLPATTAQPEKTGISVDKLIPGQEVKATVQEQVSPGLFKVQIAGQVMQMRLPGQLQAGTTMTLKVESISPHLMFSIFASSAPIATQEQISSASRLLSNLAELPLGRTLIESSSGHPVWPTAGAAPDSKQLAAGLKDALANSGLFYESHQAQWVRGERSTAQLLIEPQNQSSPQSDYPAAPDKSAAQSALPISKELLPLVQQQLHTLETHQLTWTGQIWPEQTMQWEIQGQPERQSMQPEDRQWSTEMELALPNLGDVHARLVYNQGGIRLTLQGADASSVALFNRRLQGLAATLADAGVPLTGALIEKT
ncbi:MAG: flagellar hook-length control protein FliK [Gallionella sp.]|nr:flagellar hook-length control protein FliK [Gallionella sp.]